MSDEYTPTTDQVRNNMAFGVAMAHFAPEEASNVEYPIPGWRGRAKSEFDLWLAAHDAEVKAAVLGSFAASIDLDAIANEWAGPDGSGHWSAGNAAAAVQLIIYDRAGREMRKAAPNE